jgi:hypothetical protein
LQSAELEVSPNFFRRSEARTHPSQLMTQPNFFR